jgi:mono/diheme cytochrome c family protein
MIATPRKPAMKSWILKLVVLPVLIIAAGLFMFTACGNKEQAMEKQQEQQQTAAPAARVPSFADRSKIPASGEQGPPGEATSLMGSAADGEALFAQYCASCHGPQGTDKIPNPGSGDGTVPPLNPVEPDMADKDAAVFTANIDRFIQHGSIPDGAAPELFMPDWGDGKVLSQEQIADLEAYILHLNNVNR